MIVQEKYDALCNIAVMFDVLGLVNEGMILLSQVPLYTYMYVCVCVRVYVCVHACVFVLL